MDIKDLLEIDLSKSISVFNEPFRYMGRAEITLDNGAVLYWMYDDGDVMFAVAPDEEELVLFHKIEEEIEPSDVILYQAKEYEFSYEDAGKITEIIGNPEEDEGDRYLFSDYQSQDGDTIRIITNENTGEVYQYIGKTVSEDDLTTV
jgi:hypothetical protein